MATRQQISDRAYQLWESRGGQHGQHDDDWFQAEQELGGLSVVLTSTGDNKIGVLKELRMITGLELADAKELMERLPVPLKTGVPRAEAEGIRKRLAAVGASVEIP